MATNAWLLTPALILSAVPAIYAKSYDTQYLSYQEAQKLFFPDATDFIPEDIILNEEEIEAVEQMSQVRVRDEKLKMWRVEDKTQKLGYFIIDHVIGKHKYITYGIALDADGRLKGIEILNFQESYGGEVHTIQWRAQFIGKSLNDPLRLNTDIQNISGATLSCKNVTNGVRRVLATVKVKHK